MGRERQLQKNEETRQAILEAAIAIGLEEGFDELSIRKLTDRLGYSAGIVYHYFKDKQTILDTIYTKTSMELKSNVEACINAEKGFAENTRVIFKMLSQVSAYKPDLFKLIVLNKYTHSNEAVGIWLDMIRRCVEISVESGELRDIDPDVTAHILLNSFVIAQMIINEKDNPDTDTIEKIFETELDIILNGILKEK